SGSQLFLRAEDGIRDFHVTGVQTCALPIWARPGAPGVPWPWSWAEPGRPCTRRDAPPAAASARSGARARPSRARRNWSTRRAARSEERRVGKEGGAWGRRYGSKEER